MADHGYGIWLSFNNQEEGFRLPVMPSEIEMGESGNGQTYDVSALGEINVIKSPSLTNYGFESLFPASAYPFTVKNAQKPSYYIERILKWMKSMRPVRFVFTGASFDINVPVSIESFTWREAAGSPGDVLYSLKLKKYAFFSARKVKLGDSQNTGSPVVANTQSPARASDKQQPKTYTLVAGDSLIKVARKVLGDDSRWRELQTLNGLSDADLKRLPVGLILKLPG